MSYGRIEVSLRTFVDSGGNEWQVFDVVPRTTDRRSGERRTRAASLSRAPERREAERRLTVGNLARLSTVSDGWLYFEHQSDCRRLSPIPGDWPRCTDEELEQYCQRARPVSSWRRELGREAEQKSAAAIPRR